MKAQRDALLARPDYTALLARFAVLEESIAKMLELASGTLTLLRAHDQLVLNRLADFPGPPADKTVGQ